MYEELELISKPIRKDNGYRVYTDEDIQKLKIIRSLKGANYSLSAILRMMNELSKNNLTYLILKCSGGRFKMRWSYLVELSKS